MPEPDSDLPEIPSPEDCTALIVGVGAELGVPARTVSGSWPTADSPGWPRWTR